MSDDRAKASFLGQGWSFPPEFHRESGGVVMRTGVRDIEESLRILLGTAEGERFLNPEYGLDLHPLLFEPLSTTLLTLMKDRIKTTLLIQEPRITLLNVDIDTSAQFEGCIHINLEYTVRATNSRYNLVYPFYLTDSNERRGSGAT